jgi:hypothetical protein
VIGQDGLAPVRAKDVTVDHLYRARCHRPGCTWAGREYPTYQDANGERLAHLAWHRQHLAAASITPGDTQ